MQCGACNPIAGMPAISLRRAYVSRVLYRNQHKVWHPTTLIRCDLTVARGYSSRQQLAVKDLIVDSMPSTPSRSTITDTMFRTRKNCTIKYWLRKVYDGTVVHSKRWNIRFECTFHNENKLSTVGIWFVVAKQTGGPTRKDNSLLDCHGQERVLAFREVEKRRSGSWDVPIALKPLARP